MKSVGTFFCVLVGASLVWLALFTPTAPNNTKLCAEALVTVSIGAECASTAGCVFTMTDLERLRDAQANKQNYCPVLKPGEAAANN